MQAWRRAKKQPLMKGTITDVLQQELCAYTHCTYHDVCLYKYTLNMSRV